MYTPVIDEHGDVSGVVGVAHDVTERRAAVDTLSAVLNTVGESILTLDGAGRIIMVNQALEQLFGYKQSELLGRHLARLVPACSHAQEQGSLATWLAGQNPSALGRRIQLEGQAKHGRTFPIEICINEMSLGDELCYAGSIRDLSDQMEYDRLRDEFVGTVSHELRTPLASIMGWTETLLTGHPGPLNDQQRRFLDIIYGSSVRLNRLIEEILTVSRIQRGTLRLNREAVYPSQIFAMLRDTIGKLAERQQIQVRIDDTWPADQPIVGDANLLEQTLGSLLSNAVKFSATGSEVQVHSMAVHGAWRVEVVDHGMGIPEADMPRLFQRFMRGSNARQAQIQGPGLGLYVSKAIVEGHGGEITLTSREGVGTTVWFEIPGQG
jgi:PAS domain S-box-containing protein